MKLIPSGKTLRKSYFPALLTVFLAVSSASAQGSAEPEHDKLLNGLRVLIWSRPADQDISLKLRIHSGAAFDLGGKSGEMAMLGDILFPDAETHEYFTEEMQGKLNVVTNYDSITVTMQGRATEFGRIVEILRNALVTTQITPENVSRIREARIKILKDTAISPAMLADRAIATRLFGDFPYGRPALGSVESVARVDRADLLLARERFLNPNNATLAVIGGVPANRVMRTLRQLLGIWRKSEQIVPPTFRQSPPPDERTLIVDAPGDQSVELRLATRGFSRSDPDRAAADVLAAVVRERWQKLVPELSRKPVFVRHEAHVLPGMFVLGATINSKVAAHVYAAAKNVLESLPANAVSEIELEQAKKAVAAEASKEVATPDDVAEIWLDMETYGLPSVAEQARAFLAISAKDVQRIAARLFHQAPLASVIVGNSEQVKADVGNHLRIELLGAIQPAPTPGIESKQSPSTRVPTVRSNPSSKPE